jgi:hypothetical protein
MKKISLLLFVAMLFAASGIHAAGMGDKGQFMKHMAHVNPVPNYVAYIKKNAQALNISDEQMAKVKAWYQENTEKMQQMVMSVIKGEKEMAQASMDGVSADEIKTMAEALHKTRMEIIVGKTLCRDRMMEILDKAQWEQLSALVAVK